MGNSSTKEQKQQNQSSPSPALLTVRSATIKDPATVIRTSVSSSLALARRQYFTETIRFPRELSEAAAMFSFSSSANENLGTSLTEFNNWPENLANASLYSFLLPDEILRNINSKYAAFGKFVKNTYQSACALVYAPGGMQAPVIIGSGNLISPTQVSTARHVFDEFANTALYIRFFKYQVRIISDDQILIIEDHIDIPVIDRHVAQSGLDAGYLTIATIAASLFKQYAKILPLSDSASSIYTPPSLETPPGQYGLFHFTGGRPLVSIGRVESSPLGSSPIMSVVDVAAGPGASGGAAITLMYDAIQGHAILVCRPSPHEDRRVFIDYGEIARKSVHAEVKAPYQSHITLNLLNPATLNTHGREFLRYNQATHGNRRYGGLFSSPDDLRYNVLAQHSNHHIIPIDDMIYLYEYFFHLDVATYENLRVQAAEEAKNFAEKKREKVILTPQWSTDAKDIKISQKDQFKKLFRESIENEIHHRYSEFHTLIIFLTPHENNDKTWFAWAFWNLFKGWSSVHRTDDPLRDGPPDFSEKHKPLNFNTLHWGLLKDPVSGLYILIQNLKELSRAGTYSSSVIACEAQIKNSLSKISKFWKKEITQNRNNIYTYNAEDWELVGRQFRIKQ